MNGSKLSLTRQDNFQFVCMILIETSGMLAQARDEEKGRRGKRTRTATPRIHRFRPGWSNNLVVANLSVGTGGVATSSLGPSLFLKKYVVRVWWSTCPQVCLLQGDRLCVACHAVAIAFLTTWTKRSPECLEKTGPIRANALQGAHTLETSRPPIAMDEQERQISTESFGAHGENCVLLRVSTVV